MKCLLLVATASTLFATSAHSQFEWGNTIAGAPVSASPLTKENISPVTVRLNDEATGGCWTNHAEVRSYAEAQLDLAGIVAWQKPSVTDNDYLLQVLDIEVLAGRNQNLCIGSAVISLKGWGLWSDNLEYGPAWITLAYGQFSMVHGENLNRYVLDAVRDFIDARLSNLPAK